MSDNIFGTDGIRGRANHFPLDAASVVKFGQAIARNFLVDSTRHTVLIGKDTRLSGYMIEYALSAGLTSAGANVYLTGPLPTAGVAYLARSMRADAGIMVSASHNSYEDNGIKIFAADGFKLPDSEEQKIVGLFSSPDNLALDINPEKLGKIKRIDDARGRYIVFLKNFFPRHLSLKGIKIGLDCANGAAYQVAPIVFDELGADIVTRGISPNGLNINAGFGSLHPEVISKLVVDQKLDVGFAFDGDSDRLVVVDDKGKVWDGDKLLALFADYYQSQGTLKGGGLVATVMSNIGLEDFLSQRKIELYRSKVGDRYVLDLLREKKLSVGGEQSGHIIFLEDSTCGDGILSAIKVLEIICQQSKPLSELISDYQTYPQKLTNLKVLQKTPLDQIPGYTAELSQAEKELGTKGRILIRYSGTENKVRILVEAQDEKICQKYTERFSQFLAQKIGHV